VVESGLVYPFSRRVFYAEFPSFALAILITSAFSPHLLLNGFFCRESQKEGWWLLLGVIDGFFFPVVSGLDGWVRGSGKGGGGKP